MKKNSFIDFVVKNRYVILFVGIVLVLSFLGVIRAIMEVGFTLFLILIAIYIGKRIQEDDEYIKKMFKDKQDDVIYKVKDDNDD